jgi:AraC-like DNA-binding protein
LRRLREQLDGVRDDRSGELGARFDRYLEAVAIHSGHRLDAAAGHVEAGFERLAEPLMRRGALDRKSFGSLCGDLERAAEAARTVQDLFAAYRRAVADVASAMENPTHARQDRSVRRAMDYIHHHFAEPLTLPVVARVAGFAPNYFSRLFAAREKMPFERYVARLRLERAKHLLLNTDLGADRIAELSGYGSPQYFSRAFRAALGVTPLEFREEEDHNHKNT